MITYKRLPQHIGIIPDGNRRWAINQGLEKQDGYQSGIAPGLDLYQTCIELGVKELTFYGFTADNTKRPSVQIDAFQKACIDAVGYLKNKDADLLVVGNTQSALFPNELKPYTVRTRFGQGLIKINFLVNYGWNWDLTFALNQGKLNPKDDITKSIASSEISRLDLIIRWGGRRRLSGFLPIQSIYADFFVVDSMWPEYKKTDFYDALAWYQDQDTTLGG